MDSILTESSTVTHVAAILVGVLLTLVVALSFQKKNPDAAAVKDATMGNGGVGAASKNKKKKKKKSKAASAAATTEDKVAPVAMELKEVEAPAPAPAPAPGPGPTPIVGPDSQFPGEAEAPAKKKRIRKKKGKANTNGNGNAKGNTNGNTNNSNNRSKENQSKQANAPAHESGYFQQRAPLEEEWIVETHKKKKRAKKPAAAAAAAAGTTAAAPPTSTESVTIDAKKVGIVIGPKGATMKALEEATGTKLDINAPGKDDKPSSKQIKATVVVSGSPDGIPKAKKAILELADKGYANILQGEGFAEQSIQVHPRFLSEIVGPGGTVIRRLQETLEVNVTIPPTDWKPNNKNQEVKMCNLGIAGARPNCKQAKQVIQALMRYHHHEITHPGVVHEEVDVPPEFYHCVIGPRGSEIRHIRGNYKCDVYMPSSDSYSRNVIVVGKQNMVDKTITHIMNLIDRDTERRDQKFDDEYY